MKKDSNPNISKMQILLHIVRKAIFLVSLFVSSILMKTYIIPYGYNMLSIACLPIMASCLLLYVLCELVIERKKLAYKYLYYAMSGIYLFYLINITLFFNYPDIFLDFLLFGKAPIF